MERTNKPSISKSLQVLSALVSRAQLASRMGSQYGGDRDLTQALGYPVDISFQDYASAYARQDIAKAVINRPIQATWRGDFGIVETDDDMETPLETAWDELNNRLKLKNKFARLDKLASLGEYGVLFLGFDDVKTDTDLVLPVSRAKKLLYVKPLSKSNAVINDWESDVTDERYGLPKIYNLTITTPGNSATRVIRVHHSRLIHVTGELLESEYEGVPVLEAIYNRLKDLEKIVGGSAEMFWRGGRPGYHGSVKEGVSITPETEEALQAQLDEYEHNLRRFIVTENMDINSLAQQLADPSSAVDVQIQMISAVTGIPKRILTGSERGELASSEDRQNWLDLITERREEYAEMQIVRPFMDRLIEVGVFPPAKKEYSVSWEDLYSPSDKEKAEVGKVRSETLKNYVSAPGADDVLPLESFLALLMNLSDDEIELIMEQRDQAIKEEEASMGEEEPVPPEEQTGKVIQIPVPESKPTP